VVANCEIEALRSVAKRCNDRKRRTGQDLTPVSPRVVAVDSDVVV